MEKHNKVTPKDFFLWAGSIIALYVSTVSLLALWFAYIDRLIGEVPAYADPFSTGMRIAVASLIIVFPLYLYLTRKLHQDIRSHDEKKDIWVRRWLLVLTIFGAVVTMVIDLVVLLITFLGGEEMTPAFILKVLSVLVVVGGVFYYYLHEVRGTWEKKEGASKSIAMGVSLVVLVSVVLAFFIIGTPRQLRLMRYDQEKVQALQNIQWQVINHWQQKERLPETLDELKDPIGGFVVPEDPQSREDAQYTYSYTMKNPRAFELCAFFNHASMGARADESIARPRPVSTDYYNPENEYWEHGAGRVCFERTIDAERYPPYTKPMPR